MPSSPPLIAITGINGFITTEVVLFFPSRGWAVHGSVRSPAQADKLKTHPAYEEHIASGNLKVVVVEDLAKSDFGKLLDGVNAVVSMAAPLPKLNNSILTWDAYMGPTVEPILRILHHAQKSTTIKSVASMSFLASRIELESPLGNVYTGNGWNSYTDESCKALDPRRDCTGSIIWYFAANKFAERTVLKFQETEKPAFSISTICPTILYGPAHFLFSVEDIKSVGGSQETFVGFFAGKDQPLPLHFSGTFVDVRDVAEAFYLTVANKVPGKSLISGPGMSLTPNDRELKSRANTRGLNIKFSEHSNGATTSISRWLSFARRDVYMR
ncbi:hypothetical protein IAR50_006952 [Cryptococcus sp. DSM 104548]